MEPIEYLTYTTLMVTMRTPKGSKGTQRGDDDPPLTPLSWTPPRTIVDKCRDLAEYAETRKFCRRIGFQPEAFERIYGYPMDTHPLDQPPLWTTRMRSWLKESKRRLSSWLKPN